MDTAVFFGLGYIILFCILLNHRQSELVSDISVSASDRHDDRFCAPQHVNMWKPGKCYMVKRLSQHYVANAKSVLGGQVSFQSFGRPNVLAREARRWS